MIHNYMKDEKANKNIIHRYIALNDNNKQLRFLIYDNTF